MVTWGSWGAPVSGHLHQRCPGTLPGRYFPGKNDVAGTRQLCDPLGAGRWKMPSGLLKHGWLGKSPMNNGKIWERMRKHGKSLSKMEVLMRTWSINDVFSWIFHSHVSLPAGTQRKTWTCRKTSQIKSAQPVFLPHLGVCRQQQWILAVSVGAEGLQGNFERETILGFGATGLTQYSWQFWPTVAVAIPQQPSQQESPPWFSRFFFKFVGS